MVTSTGTGLASFVAGSNFHWGVAFIACSSKPVHGVERLGHGDLSDIAAGQHDRAHPDAALDPPPASPRRVFGLYFLDRLMSPHWERCGRPTQLPGSNS